MKNLLASILVLAACAASDAGPEKRSFTPSGKQEVAILAGGCFWGMENVMRQAPGVLSIEVGYAGGKDQKVGYEDVASGSTGHAESVRIVFDPTQISYADLLSKWYFRGHDPTQLDHQNNDHGTQYRSEIFTTRGRRDRMCGSLRAPRDLVPLPESGADERDEARAVARHGCPADRDRGDRQC